MTTQHTPGPWITGDAAIWALNDCEFHAIVDCPLNQTCRDTDTAWANARLIAAAPDLLAALKAFDDAFSHYCEGDPDSDEVSALYQAREAIAKAIKETA